jgi:hypothetical protein
MKFLKKAFAMSILLGVFIAQFAFIPLVNAQEGQVTPNPTDDTYCDSNNPDSNYGGQTVLHISRYEVYEIYEEIVWLKFNLSDVPDGAVVDVATLELYTALVTETYNVYAHSCSDNSWTEFTLTYSNMPTFNATSMDSALVTSSLEWYSWNVVDAVRKAVDGIHGGPDAVTIVLLETSLRGTLSSVSFDSKEAILYPPKLTIHWSDIIPEFPTWTSMLLMLIMLTVATALYKRRLLKTPTP